jgi:hypothetical protein
LEVQMTNSLRVPRMAIHHRLNDLRERRAVLDAVIQLLEQYRRTQNGGQENFKRRLAKKK